jgi:hypothetical protein
VKTGEGPVVVPEMGPDEVWRLMWVYYAACTAKVRLRMLTFEGILAVRKSPYRHIHTASLWFTVQYILSAKKSLIHLNLSWNINIFQSWRNTHISSVTLCQLHYFSECCLIIQNSWPWPKIFLEW